MRFRPLGRLAFGVTLLPLALTMTTDAPRAQTCGSPITASEVAIEFSDPTNTATLTLYDRNGVAAAPVSIFGQPNTSGITAIPITRRQAGGCDAFVGFTPHGANESTGKSIVYGRAEQTGSPAIPPPALPNTFEFSVTGPTDATAVVHRFVYSSLSQNLLDGSFFEPSGSDNVDFYARIESSRVRISPDEFWGVNSGAARFMDEVVPDDSWVYPYHAVAYCAVVSCGTDPILATANPFLMPVDAVFVYGQPFLKALTPALSMVFPSSSAAVNWQESWLTLAFGPSTRLDISEEQFNVSGMTFTASNAAQGWAGVRFLPGSGGAWTNGTTVERVGGGTTSGFSPSTAHAVTVTDASPTFSNIIIQNAAQFSSVNGLYVTGPAASPVATGLRVENMTASGVVVDGGATATLVQGTFVSNDGTGVVAGLGSHAYLVAAPIGPRLRGPVVTQNTNGGVLAVGTGADIQFSRPTNPTDGYASVRQNSAGGLTASGGGVIYAGTGTTSSGAYRRNQVLDNATANPATGNGLATGAGSRVYARCNWWGPDYSAGLRVGAASGGLFDASIVLTQDPYAVATPPCVMYNPPGRPVRGAAWTAASTASRGDEASALDRLDAAVTAGSPEEAAGLLAALVADEPETEAAAAALGEAGGIAGRPGAPSSVTALLEQATTSAYGALRVAAWQSLVASRRAAGDRAGALAAADALANEGGAAIVQAELARVYLHAEEADTTAALGALAALEALAPESVEVELARAFLGDEGPQTGGGRAAISGDAAAVASKATAVTDAATFALSPNPAASSAAVTLTLAEPSDVTVTVYDLLGRAVQTPFAGTLTAGAHRAEIDARALAPGVYVVRATVNTGAGTGVQSARLAIVR